MLHNLALLALDASRVAECCSAVPAELEDAVRAVPGVIKPERTMPPHSAPVTVAQLAAALHATAAAVAATVTADEFDYAAFVLGAHAEKEWSQLLADAALEASWPAVPGACAGGSPAAAASGDALSADPTADVLVDELPVEATRAAFNEQGGWAVIDGVLDPHFAARLKQQLESAPDESWHQADWISAEQRSRAIRNSPDNAHKLREVKEASIRGSGAGNHFGYVFLRTQSEHNDVDSRCPRTPPYFRSIDSAADTSLEGQTLVEDAPLCALERAFRSERMTNFITAVTGIKVGSEHQDFFASWYRPGDYLAWHTDTFANRAVAFRLGVTDSAWPLEAGGDLMFDDAGAASDPTRSNPTANKIRASAKLNSLVLFDVRRPHAGHQVQKKLVSLDAGP